MVVQSGRNVAEAKSLAATYLYDVVITGKRMQKEPVRSAGLGNFDYFIHNRI